MSAFCSFGIQAVCIYLPLRFLWIIVNIFFLPTMTLQRRHWIIRLVTCGTVDLSSDMPNSRHRTWQRCRADIIVSCDFAQTVASPAMTIKLYCIVMAGCCATEVSRHRNGLWHLQSGSLDFWIFWFPGWMWRYIGNTSHLVRESHLSIGSPVIPETHHFLPATFTVLTEVTSGLEYSSLDRRCLQGGRHFRSAVLIFVPEVISYGKCISPGSEYKLFFTGSEVFTVWRRFRSNHEFCGRWTIGLCALSIVKTLLSITRS